MKRLFVDTSALIALKDSGDERHGEALRFFEPLLADARARLVVTNYVIFEVHAYFCRTPGVALEFVDALLTQPIFRVIRASPRDERRALEILRSSRDKTYSLADAVSFAVMERVGLKEAFAFDRHFRQRGTIKVLPSVV